MTVQCLEGRFRTDHVICGDRFDVISIHIINDRFSDPRARIGTMTRSVDIDPTVIRFIGDEIRSVKLCGNVEILCPDI